MLSTDTSSLSFLVLKIMRANINND